jgi:NitT/TauT family transport system permease protein
MKLLKSFFEPFREITKTQLYTIFFLQLVIILGYLEINQGDIIPSPYHIMLNFGTLLSSADFYDNLFRSFTLIIYGMGVAIIISLLLSYLSVIPFFKSIISLITSFRYLTLTGLTFIFTMLSKDTDALRTNLLLFAIIPFFTTSMLDVINKTSKQDVELCYTLKKNRWWILYEVIIIGKIDQVFEVIRSNFAICWLMITFVESLALNLGGVGTMLVKANKYVNMEQIIPILLAILLIGIVTDYILNFMKIKLFKYSNITTI